MESTLFIILNTTDKDWGYGDESKNGDRKPVKDAAAEAIQTRVLPPNDTLSYSAQGRDEHYLNAKIERIHHGINRREKLKNIV